MFDQIARDEAANAKQRNAIADSMSKQINAISRQQRTAADNEVKNTQRIQDAQNRAWASYGKNLLASEKLDNARAQSLREKFSRIIARLHLNDKDAPGERLRTHSRKA